MWAVKTVNDSDFKQPHFLQAVNSRSEARFVLVCYRVEWFVAYATILYPVTHNTMTNDKNPATKADLEAAIDRLTETQAASRLISQ